MKKLIILAVALPIFAYVLACGMVMPGMQKQVNDAVNIYSEEHNDTGIWLLVEKNGKQYKAAAGLADREHNITVKPEQLFEIGSASKVLTGIAIFQLIEQGKLSLHTKLNTFYQ
ncbi:MAG TPA: class A beta-lactamase-related serine hydrolase, partial [Epsilonproteobacteria bacterium]|nr:class A beta-lactamase-related serine hydrolase [Campylobacterota bacterium]